MPTVANFSVLRVDRIELLPAKDPDPGPRTVADFQVTTVAAQHPAVLSLVISPAFEMSLGTHFRFALDLNGRQLMSDTITLPQRPATLLLHSPRNELVVPATVISIVLPVVDPLGSTSERTRFTCATPIRQAIRGSPAAWACRTSCSGFSSRSARRRQPDLRDPATAGAAGG